jgi:signal transduction histidine kinase
VSSATALWPLALTMTSVIAGCYAWHRRRRERLNCALHELRRPLQAMALGAQLTPTQPGAEVGSLDLALAALTELDEEINGTGAAPALRPVSGRALVEAAIERWRGPAAAAGHSLELSWRAGRATVLADPAQVSQALDNLISNSLEHGGLRVCASASICVTGLRIELASDPAPDRGRPWRRRDPRRGHGLAVAARVAASHGGRFRLRLGQGGAIAVLELPLAASPITAARRLDTSPRAGLGSSASARRAIAG